MATETSLFMSLLNLLSNPMLLAGAGGFAGYQYFGKGKGGKMPYYAAGGGIVAGYLVGKGLQSFLAPKASVVPPQFTVIPQGVSTKATQATQTTQSPLSLLETPYEGAKTTAASVPASASTPVSASSPIGTKEDVPIGEKSMTDILDSFGSFDDGEYGSLSPDRGWSEEEAVGNLAEVDTDTVSLGTRVQDGKGGNGHARGRR